MDTRELEGIARSLVSKGKGILAADESFGTIKKRLATINVESTEKTRRTYREMLFTTPGMEEFISGVILYDETIRQKAQDGTPLPEVLSRKGVIPGIKVDTGAKELAGFPGERITEGLDGLRERLVEYRALGAKFAKWRAVINIGPGIPTRFCIFANAHALARYAALCQEAGLVPIVEPEVMMTGDHDIQRCEEITTVTLHHVFSELLEHRVVLEGILLKPNMVLSGKGCLPLRWPDSRTGHRKPQRDECPGRAPLGTQFLLRPGIAAASAPGVERGRDQSPCCPGGLLPAGKIERCRALRPVLNRDGSGCHLAPNIPKSLILAPPVRICG